MRIHGLVVSAFAVVGAVAMAQAASAREGERDPDRNRNIVFAPSEVAVSAGGGVSDFALSSYRSISDPGAAWDARVTLGARSILALEAAYVGTLQSVANPFGTSPQLQSNSAEALGRINLPNRFVEPFVVGGAGYINYHRYGGDQAPDVASNVNHDADSVVFPVGAGVATYLGGHAMIDARFTYRFVPTSLAGTAMDRVSNVTDQRADNWMATLRAGYSF